MSAQSPLRAMRLDPWASGYFRSGNIRQLAIGRGIQLSLAHRLARADGSQGASGNWVPRRVGQLGCKGRKTDWSASRQVASSLSVLKAPTIQADFLGLV